MADNNFTEIVEKIEKLTVLELSQLVKELEEKFGVSAAAPMMMAAAPAGGVANGGEAEEEKTAFTVMLTGAGDQKINVIKAVREIRSDLGLKEAKDLVEAAPKEVLVNVKKEEAQAAEEKLKAVGATVEVK